MKITVSALAIALVAIVGLVALPLAFSGPAQPNPSSFAATDIPPTALAAYQRAAGSCDGLRWEVLAGIGKIESGHGSHAGATIAPNGDVTPPIFGPPLNGTGIGGNTTPMRLGRWAGQWGLTGQWLRAVGPMQFLPATFAAHATDGSRDGRTDPHNYFDATATAAAYLCSAAGGPIGEPGRERDAIWAYNHSNEYVDTVLFWAARYAVAPTYAPVAATELLDHPNLTLSEGARQDITAGIVDPRIVSLLTHLAQRWELYVGVIQTGHSRCVGGYRADQGPGCTVSNHFHARAIDISAVNPPGAARQSVTPENNHAQAIVELLAGLAPENPLRPAEVGSPWPQYEPTAGHFSDSGHLDHLHIGYLALARIFHRAG